MTVFQFVTLNDCFENCSKLQMLKIIKNVFGEKFKGDTERYLIDLTTLEPEYCHFLIV